MAKKQFKAESKRLLDLMINSIYTHKEIFLRELISNASDAVDKLAYKALTDDSIDIKRSDFQIKIIPDKEARTLTIEDNGIGMTKEELEQNLGTIARSGSLRFKEEMAKAENAPADSAGVDIIGQFGVGFYSAFMVADRVTVRSKAYGSEEAWEWESDGTDGYTVEPCEKDTLGTQIVLHIKPDTEEDHFSEYLETYRLQDLVKTYSDYVHTPVRMEMEHTHAKPRPEDAGEDYQTEYETHREWETLNSMTPLWNRSKNEITEEEYHGFYREKFGDWEEPLAVIHTAAEGQMEYKALLFIPSHAPYDYYTKSFEKGLQLYSSGVLIMDKCPDVVPDAFSFVKGVVDSADLPLNISRETLQHTRALHIIENNVEKKVKAELLKIQKDDREKYLKFWKGFARQLKYGIVDQYGAKKDLLKDLLLFPTSKGDELVTLKEYKERMAEGQESIFYLCAESVEMAKAMPQAERVLDKGYEILYFTDEVDQFLVQTLMDYEGTPFKDVTAPDALPQTDEEKAESEKRAEANKSVLDFVKETLGDKVSDVRLSQVLKSGAVCLTTDGPVTIEMEKYFRKMEGEMGGGMKAQRVLELNADCSAYSALAQAVAREPEKAKEYAELLYDQALLLAGLPVDDMAAYTERVCKLMV